MTTCSFEGCNRPHSAKGLCKAHYWQKQQGKPLKPLKEWRGKGLLSASLTQSKAEHDRDPERQPPQTVSDPVSALDRMTAWHSYSPPDPADTVPDCDLDTTDLLVLGSLSLSPCTPARLQSDYAAPRQRSAMAERLARLQFAGLIDTDDRGTVCRITASGMAALDAHDSRCTRHPAAIPAGILNPPQPAAKQAR